MGNVKKVNEWTRKAIRVDWDRLIHELALPFDEYVLFDLHYIRKMSIVQIYHTINDDKGEYKLFLSQRTIERELNLIRSKIERII